MKTIYPADTVDSLGKVYPTVGENIRNGAKNLNLDSLLELYSKIYNTKCAYDIVTFKGEINKKITIDNSRYSTTNFVIYINKGLIFNFFVLEYKSSSDEKIELTYINNTNGVAVKHNDSNDVSGKILIIRSGF